MQWSTNDHREQAFLFFFFSGKLLSRRPDDWQGGVEGKERNQSCLVERFDGNRSVGKSKGSRIDDDRKLFLICVSRVAVSLVKKDSLETFFFFFFLEERSSVCRHSVNRFYAVTFFGRFVGNSFRIYCSFFPSPRLNTEKVKKSKSYHWRHSLFKISPLLRIFWRISNCYITLYNVFKNVRQVETSLIQRWVLFSENT